jgi:hypothetical protein
VKIQFLIKIKIKILFDVLTRQKRIFGRLNKKDASDASRPKKKRRFGRFASEKQRRFGRFASEKKRRFGRFASEEKKIFFLGWG